MNPHATDSARDILLRHIVEALLKDGYAEPGATAEEYGRAFQRMRSDAEEGRKKATPASGRAVALAFLKATVEDVHKPMAERMEAARTLLMYGAEET